ncbi:hypothetical protein Peur_064374 [Populus x canadensis]
MIVNKHLQKSSNGVGLGAQHCRKCPSNIWIETFSGVIVEDEEADPLILDLPFTLALPIYFGSFPHCLRTSISLNGSFLRKTVNYCGNLLILFCSGMYLQIGQYISSNGGVVAAEELAPFLDVKTTEDMLIIPHGSFNHFGCFALLQESERLLGSVCALHNLQVEVDPKTFGSTVEINWKPNVATGAVCNYMSEDPRQPGIAAGWHGLSNSSSFLSNIFPKIKFLGYEAHVYIDVHILLF